MRKYLVGWVMTLPYPWSVAEDVCTSAELEVLDLRDRRGLSPRAIAMVLGVSRWSVRDRLESAERKIYHALNPEGEAA